MPIYAPGAIAYGNGKDGFHADGGTIIAPGAQSFGNGGHGFSAQNGGTIDLTGRSLLQELGLPEDTDIRQLAALLNVLRRPENATPAAREETVKKSGLFGKLGGAVLDAAIGKLTEKLFDAAMDPALYAQVQALATSFQPGA